MQKISLKNMWLIAFCVLVTVGNFLQNKFVLILALFCILLQMVANKDVCKNFYLCLFLIPCIRIFDFVGVTYIVNILLLVALLIYIIRTKKLNTFAFASSSILFLFEVFHIFTLGNIDNLISNISLFVLMFYVLSITIDYSDKLTLHSIWIYLIGGILFSSISYIACNAEYFGTIVRQFTQGYRFSAYGSDPNYFSLYICLALSLFFVLNKTRLIDFLVFLSLVAIGLLTCSKMCLLLMVFIVSVGVLFNLASLNDKKRQTFGITALIFLLISAFTFRNQINLFIGNFFRRVGDINDLNSVTSGRFEIFTNYISIYFSNFKTILIGSGLQYHLYLGEIRSSGAHNTYFDVFLAWGTVGFFALFLIIYIWNKKIVKIENKHLIDYLPLAALLINFLDLSCLSASMFWVVLSVPILTLKIKKDENRVVVHNKLKVVDKGVYNGFSNSASV